MAPFFSQRNPKQPVILGARKRSEGPVFRAILLADDERMIGYALWFYWVAARGYRLRPWASPLLKWRIETYSGIPAEQVTFRVFWEFLWRERGSLREFLKWGARMRKLEAHRRDSQSN